MHLIETIAHLFHPRRSNNHRARLLHPENLFSIFLIIFGFGLAINNLNLISPDLGSILGYASDISIDQVVSSTNAERVNNGLGSVTLNDKLSSAARAKAADMFAQQYWAHVSPTGRQPWDFIKEAGYSFGAAGENLARDFSTTPDMMAAWMGSSSHRANIMNGQYTEMGVAVVNGNLEGVDTTLVVQMFGRPAGTRTPAVTTEASQKVIEQAASETSTSKVVPQVVNPNTNPFASTTPTPQPTPTPIIFGETQVQPATIPLPTTSSDVLADIAVPVGTLSPDKISPLEIMKPVFLSILVLIILTLAYDAHMFEGRNTFRVVGKNLAHILYLAVITAIVVIFKAGVIK